MSLSVSEGFLFCAFCPWSSAEESPPSPLHQGENPSPHPHAIANLLVLLVKEKKICVHDSCIYLRLWSPFLSSPCKKNIMNKTPSKLYFASYTAESTARSFLFLFLAMFHPALPGWAAFSPITLLCNQTWDISLLSPIAPPCLFIWYKPHSFLLNWYPLFHNSYPRLRTFICNNISSMHFQVPWICSEWFS